MMGKTKILVVEDEFLVARDLQVKLTSLGYDVPLTVTSGPAALAAISEIDPDLLLMDIRLKGPLDGIETATQTMAEFDIPVVYLTAYGDEETVRRARSTRPIGYIHKPFTLKTLRSTLEIALDRHRDEDEFAEKYNRLQNGHQRLRFLLQKMTVGWDAEKHHLAYELENQVAQVLLAAQIHLGAASLETDRDELIRKMDEINQILKLSGKQLHDFIEDIRSPMLDIIGLVPALRSMLDQKGRAAGFVGELRSNSDNLVLPKEIEIGCYHFVSKAVANIAQHTQANHVQVDLQASPEQLDVIIQFDGVWMEGGAEPDLNRGEDLNFAILQAQVEILNGHCEIYPSPEAGTTIKASFPLLDS